VDFSFATFPIGYAFITSNYGQDVGKTRTNRRVLSEHAVVHQPRVYQASVLTFRLQRYNEKARSSAIQITTTRFSRAIVLTTSKNAKKI
jgi:hypothetical protein